MVNPVLTSKELIKKLRMSKDTLKHWRYGCYMSSEGEKKVFYRKDHKGVPCRLVSGKGFDYYEYTIPEVIAWVESWQTPSQKKISVLKKLAGIK